MSAFIEFLNEGSNDYDLHSKYNEFNKLYFKGDLPNIKLKWTKSRKLAGQVRVRLFVRKVMGKKVIESFEILDLGISRYYERTEAELDSIMLHEMIHVYLDHNGIHEGYDGVKIHGKEFVSKANEISKKSNIEITLVDTFTKSKLSSSSVKEVGIVLAKTNAGYVISVMNKNTYLKNYKTFTSDRWDFNGNLLKLGRGIVSNELIGKYPIQRTNRLGFYRLDDNSIGDSLMKLLDASKEEYQKRLELLNTKIVINAPKAT